MPRYLESPYLDEEARYWALRARSPERDCERIYDDAPPARLTQPVALRAALAARVQSHRFGGYPLSHVGPKIQ